MRVGNAAPRRSVAGRGLLFFSSFYSITGCVFIGSSGLVVMVAIPMLGFDFRLRPTQPRATEGPPTLNKPVWLKCVCSPQTLQQESATKKLFLLIPSIYLLVYISVLFRNENATFLEIVRKSD